MKSKHLIVVSVDALVFEDLEYAKTLPMFGKILREGSMVERVKTIYPSLTHPVHASLLTGCPAGVTGIVSNTHFTPVSYTHLDVYKRQPPWRPRPRHRLHLRSPVREKPVFCSWIL